MKEVRKHVIAAARFTLLVIGPASLIAGIVLVVSDNRAIASLIFFVAVAIELSAAVLWKEKQIARQKQGTTNPIPEAHMTVHEFIAHVNEQEQGANPMPEAHMTVHKFIAHVKMHPELLPATMTEFDLERLRKVCSKKESQAEFGNWMKQLINSATAS